MKKLAITLAVAVACTFLGLSARATFDKTIKGEAQCGKCTLKETPACQAVIKVKEGDKTVTYYIEQNDVAKKTHGKICPPNSKAVMEVTGDVKEKDGKMVLTPTKIEVVE
ncbi:MAG: DUF6370 family protein [Isosphaeraceae bacterium]